MNSRKENDKTNQKQQVLSPATVELNDDELTKVVGGHCGHREPHEHDRYRGHENWHNHSHDYYRHNHRSDRRWW